MIENPLPTKKRAWFIAFIAASIIAFIVISGFSISGGNQGFPHLRSVSLRSTLAPLSFVSLGLAKPDPRSADNETSETNSTIKNKLQNIEQTQLSWSKIVEKIETTIPKLKDSNEPIVEFGSYNGTQDGKITVSATTRKGAFDAFSDVALLIRAFATEPAFQNVFVPSITKSLIEDGSTVLNFSLNFEYTAQVNILEKETAQLQQIEDVHGAAVISEVEQKELSQAIPENLDQDTIILDINRMTLTTDVSFNALTFSLELAEKLPAVTISASFQGTQNNIIRFLKMIEVNQRKLVVKNASVSLADTGGGLALVNLNLTIEGFYRVES